MDQKITSYAGINAGESIKDIDTGNTGIIVEFERVPDGMIVIFQNEETGKKYGAYLHNTEWNG